MRQKVQWKHFLLEPGEEANAPHPVLRALKSLKRQFRASAGAKFKIGISKKFGHFILMIESTNAGPVTSAVYVERNQAYIEDFMEWMLVEEPVAQKELRVNKQNVGTDANGDRSFMPRVYLDGRELRDAGFDIGDQIVVEFNCLKQTITIRKKND